jgi:cysteine desulfurase
MLHKAGHIITSAIEHPSVFNTVKHLEAPGFEATFIGSDSAGVVKLEDLGKAVRKDTILISIMHSNNETGIMQPIEDIAKLAKRHGIPLHVDAAQSIGKSHFNLRSSDVDMLTLVPHKFYGPKGVGALYIRCGVKISPLMFGAGHEMGLRPGTENIPGIAGFAKACQITMRDLDLRVSHTAYLREILLKKLQDGIPDIVLNGHNAKSLPNTLNVISLVISDDLVIRSQIR